MFDLLRRLLAKKRMKASGPDRRVRMVVEEPSERFVLSIALMIVFFIGLVVLEVVHVVFLRTWNDVIFNGIMLLVGSLMGALFGYREAP